MNHYLINSTFYGDDPRYGIGVVEDVKDPLKAGRVRVRIFGLHTSDLNDLPTDDLPWSQVLTPVTSASISGIGQSPTGIENGSQVYGMFLDGETKQQFLVLGTMPGISYQTDIQRQQAQDKITENIDDVNATTFSANSNSEKAFSYFISKGYSEDQAAGIVGSLAFKSGDNLNTNQTGGIGSLSDDRYKEYKQYAASRKKSISDLDTQLDYINSELNSEKYASVNNRLKNTKDANDAALVFSRDYLGDASTMSTRQTKARQVKAAYGSSLGSTGNFETVSRPDKSYKLGDIIESEDELLSYFVSAKRQVTETIVHHTDTYENQHVDAFDIDAWHKSRTPPFSEIGYHFLILRNGELQIGRNIDKVGAHASEGGHNLYSIGIAFVGGIKGSSKASGKERSANTFSQAQWNTFDKFVKTCIKRWPNINFLGHMDTDPKRRTDPEFDVSEYVKAKFDHENTSSLDPRNPETIPDITSPAPSSSSVETSSGSTPVLEDAVPDEQVTIVLESGEVITTPPGSFNEIIDIAAIIAAALAASGGSGGGGTVTSVAIAGTASQISVSGSPITSSGTITLSLDSAVTASLALANSAIQPGDSINDLTGTDEIVQDIIGTMLTGNTETLISVTYQDADGTIDFVVEDDLSLYDNTTSGFISNLSGFDTGDLSEGSNLYYTQARVQTEIDSYVDKPFIDALNVDADTLDGNDSTAFALLSGAEFTGRVDIGAPSSGLAGASADLIIAADSPRLIFNETDAATDEKNWDILTTSGAFFLRALNDANSVGTNIIRIDRTGTTIDTVVFSSGNVGIGVSSPDQPLEVAGIIKISDATPQAGFAALSRTMVGLELATGSSGMNTTNLYTAAIKFMSIDRQFTTENPKFLAAIAGAATETYNVDTRSGMALHFAVTDNSQGASSVPTVRMILNNDGGLTVGSPTGGSKGAGTINAVAVYDDNVLLTCYVLEAWLDGQVDVEFWDNQVADIVELIPVVDEKGEPVLDTDGNPEYEERITKRQHDRARLFANVAQDRLNVDSLMAYVKDKRHMPAFPNPEKWKNEGNLSTGQLVQRLWETIELNSVMIFQARERELELKQQLKNFKDDYDTFKSNAIAKAQDHESRLKAIETIIQNRLNIKL